MPPSGELGVVERLDADAVAREREAPRARVPDREREHAVELAHAALAVLLEVVEIDLGVAAGREAVARALERRRAAPRSCRSRR